MIAAFLAVYSQFLYDKEQRTTFASNTDFSHSNTRTCRFKWRLAKTIFVVLQVRLCRPFTWL